MPPAQHHSAAYLPSVASAKEGQAPIAGGRCWGCERSTPARPLRCPKRNSTVRAAKIGCLVRRRRGARNSATKADRRATGHPHGNNQRPRSSWTNCPQPVGCAISLRHSRHSLKSHVAPCPCARYARFSKKTPTPYGRELLTERTVHPLTGPEHTKYSIASCWYVGGL